MPFPALYGITDARFFSDKNFLTRCETALKNGLGILQYRDKTAEVSKRLSEARALAALCHRYNAIFIVNDDIDLACAVNADGVHLGQNDSDLKEARKRLGPDAIIGATCHDSLVLAEAAESAGASYLAFGRFFPSHTKEQAKAANLAILSAARKHFSLPLVAIGGINLDNAERVYTAGADCVAVCHSLFSAHDIALTINRFKHLGAQHD